MQKTLVNYNSKKNHWLSYSWNTTNYYSLHLSFLFLFFWFVVTSIDIQEIILTLHSNHSWQSLRYHKRCQELISDQLQARQTHYLPYDNPEPIHWLFFILGPHLALLRYNLGSVFRDYAWCSMNYLWCWMVTRWLRKAKTLSPVPTILPESLFLLNIFLQNI